MVQNQTGLFRDLIIHPGETLNEILSEREMSQKELAERTGISEKHVSTVIRGMKGISVSFAKKLEYVLGIDASFWINLQSNYERELFEFEEANSISEEELAVIKPLKAIIGYLNSLDLISLESNEADTVLTLRKILGISNLTLIPQITYKAMFRAQDSCSTDLYVMFAWQRICEMQASQIEVHEAVNLEKLRLNLNRIKSLMFENPDIIDSELTKIFAGCGIAFKIVPHFTGAPVQGFISRMENGKMMLCMTLRQSFADRFWFTLFHEIAHILSGDVKKKFVDFSSVNNDLERHADEFARDMLLNPKEYQKFLEKKHFTYDSICKFAESEEVMPYIVLGRLKKEGFLDWSQFNGAMVCYNWLAA